MPNNNRVSYVWQIHVNIPFMFNSDNVIQCRLPYTSCQWVNEVKQTGKCESTGNWPNFARVGKLIKASSTCDTQGCGIVSDDDCTLRPVLC